MSKLQRRAGSRMFRLAAFITVAIFISRSASSQDAAERAPGYQGIWFTLGQQGEYGDDCSMKSFHGNENSSWSELQLIGSGITSPRAGGVGLVGLTIFAGRGAAVVFHVFEALARLTIE